jgi:hypothetical protein
VRNAIQVLLNAIDRDPSGVAVVRCPDLGLRDWLVQQVEGLAPTDAQPLRTDSVEVALGVPDRLALLIPGDERETVLELDASRDRILQEPERTQPIVLFLLRDGDGEAALRTEAPSLRSWVSGSDADPESLAQVDVPTERAAFERKHGLSPEAWLDRWRSGELLESGQNFRTAHDALLLEKREVP